MCHLRRAACLAVLLAACIVVSGAEARRAGPAAVAGDDKSVWTETTVCTAGCSGTYQGVYTLSPSSLSGTLASGGATYTVTTTRNGASFTMHTTGAGGYTSDAKGTLSVDGKSMSGTFSDVQGGSGTWTAILTSGPPATVTPPPTTTTSTTASCSKHAARAGSSPPLPTTQPMAHGAGVIIDMQQAKGASTISIDLNHDGHPDDIGPASYPFVGIVPSKPLRTTIDVTTTCASGATTSTPIKLSIPGTGNLRHPTPSTVIFTPSSSLLNDATRAAGCIQAIIVEGLIEARGCFRLVTSPGLVPVSERATAQSYYRQTGRSANNYSVYVSSSAIEVNGLTIAPPRFHAVVVDPGANHVFSSDAKLSLGKISLESGAIDLDFTNLTPASGDQPDASFNGISHPALSFDPRNGFPGGLLGGFPIDAGAELAFAAQDGVRESQVTVHVTLPPLFDTFGDGPQPSGTGTGVATNDEPLHVETVDFLVPHASVAGIELDNLSFHYDAAGDKAADCGADYWKATGEIHLGLDSADEPGAGFKFAPDPPQNGIAFCKGDFKSFGGQFQFGDPVPPPELFPGVLLDQIGFGLQLQPPVLNGNAAISAVELFRIDGTLFAAFPTTSDPYVLSDADGAGFDLLSAKVLKSTTFAIAGDLKLTVPGFPTLDIARGALMYKYPAYIEAAAKVDVQLGIYYFTASAHAWLDAEKRLFELDLDGHICMRLIHLCGGGTAIVSSKGVVACLDLSAFGGSVHPGVGVMPGQFPKIWLPDGCKPSEFWVQGLRDARRTTRTRSFDVAPGEAEKSVLIRGMGGAPKVVVQGPGGAQLTLDGTGVKRSGPISGLRADAFRETAIGIEHGKPGHYTITLLSKSVPFGQLLETRKGYESTFSGKVVPAGSGLVLHYDAGKAGGDRTVSFWEDGTNVRHELATFKGGTGTLRFIPAPGVAGDRTIVARATVNGIQIPDQVVAHFHFGGTPKTGEPGKVTVRRKGATLVVGWAPAVGAVRYGIVVDEAGGAQQSIDVPARQHTVRFTHFPATAGGTVSVTARGVLGDWGPARKSAAFKAVAKPFSILVPARK